MMDRDDGPNCDHADLVHRANKLLKASGIPTQTNTHMIDSSPTHRLNLMRLFMSAVLGIPVEDVRLTRDEQDQMRLAPKPSMLS